jgi:hypothetical protein
LTNVVELVTRTGEMSEEDKELSYKYLDQLRTWIEEGRVSSWLYVGVSAETVYNAAVAAEIDGYKLIGMLDATKTALIHNTTLFTDAEDVD